MSALVPFPPQRTGKAKPAALAFLLVALASVGTVELLHGHACAGDGCALCIVATCAHILLAVCLGAALACPVVRIASEMRVSCRALQPRPGLAAPVYAGSRPQRTEITPVTMRVRLLI